MNIYTITTETHEGESTHDVEGTHYRKTNEGNLIVFNKQHDEENVAEVDGEHFVSIIKQ
jgi:hypothetical protein